MQTERINALLAEMRGWYGNDPGKWCKGMNASTSSGKRTSELNPAAASMCLAGCVRSVTYAHPGSEYCGLVDIILGRIKDRTGDRSMVGYNDRPAATFHDILAVLEPMKARLG